MNDEFNEGLPPREQQENVWISRDDLRNIKPSADMRSYHVDINDKREWGEESKLAIQAIEYALGDNAVSEIHCSGPDHIECKAGGDRFLLTDVNFTSDEEYVDYIKYLVDRAESVHDWNSAEKRGRVVIRMHDGSRLAVMLHPFSNKPLVSIRKHNLVSFTPKDMVDNGTFSPVMMRFLKACVAAKTNILFVGDMGSGKTSALSIMGDLIGDNERIIVLEEVQEIWIGKPLVTNITYLPTEEGYGLADALDHILYSGPDRVIVGEIHMVGLTNMFEIMVAGSEGSMGTYHAGSAQQAIKRMKVALQEENPSMTSDTALERIQGAVDMIVVMRKTLDGHKCVEMSEIDWKMTNVDGRLATTTLFEYDHVNKKHRVVSKLDQETSRIQQKSIENLGKPIDPNWFVSDDDIQQYGGKW